MTFLKKIQEKESLWNTVLTITVVVLAFFAALFFRRSAGVPATFPIAFLLFGIGAFIKISFKVKLAVFGGSVFIFNTLENEDITVALIFTALCLLACFLFELSANAVLKRKNTKYIISVSSILICFALSFIFIGNPISAIKAKGVLKDYTKEKYLVSDSANETFEFTEIYFNYKTRAYEIGASSREYPTETALISTKEGLVYDGFETLVETHLTTPYILEITEVLRNTFTEDSFAVRADEIQRRDQKDVIFAEEGELYGRIVFEITLGGVQTAEDMEKKVIQYTTVIDNANIDYAKIIYKSGINPWVRKSATVTKNRPFGDYGFTVFNVPAFSSNLFNRLTLSPFPLD